MENNLDLENKNLFSLRQIPDPLKIVIFIFMMLIFGALFSSLAAIILGVWYNLAIFPLNNLVSELATMRIASIVLQIFSSIGAFIVPALVYAIFFEQKPGVFFKAQKFPSLKTLVFTFLVFFLANFVLNLLVQFTQLIPFETFDHQFIKNILEKEALTKEAFKTFLNFSSPLYFVLVFVMMAVLPALGEELSFRGVFYTLFKRSSKSTVFAIVFSGFIFALIHFQLYNFLAIFFMGCLLAYIYYISKNIWVSIAAHLFNNGIIVIGSYLSHLDLIEYDFSKNDDLPIIVSIFGSLIFFISLYFYRLLIQKEKLQHYE